MFSLRYLCASWSLVSNDAIFVAMLVIMISVDPHLLC